MLVDSQRQGNQSCIASLRIFQGCLVNHQGANWRQEILWTEYVNEAYEQAEDRGSELMATSRRSCNGIRTEDVGDAERGLRHPRRRGEPLRDLQAAAPSKKLALADA